MENEKKWKNYCLNPDNIFIHNDINLISGGEDAFPLIIEKIKSAKKFIFLEVYSFGDDHIGRLFSEILAEKARQGVKVYIIYDSIGSIATGGNFFKNMKKKGIRVKEYHQAVPWKPHWNLFRRDHRKLLCIDGETAFIGGFNITEYAAPKSMGGRGWKDMAAEIKGDIVAAIEREFLFSWEMSPGDGDDIYSLNAGKKNDSSHKGTMIASIVSASGIRNMMSIRRSYKYAIEKAKEYIFITNAYFLPDKIIYRKLIKAAQKGIDIRIIAPSNTDHPYVRWASWALYTNMIKNGIKIYEWQGAILHSKAAIIDGIWSSVGSHNLDHRSLYYNLELNINIFDKTFGAKMEEVFFADLKNSRRITINDCVNRRLLSKIGSKALYFFRSWL
ncbi:MAG: phospholipase D-like domain-containing protein [Elusimicrobia bacterium]|nr:phospholipase D-like domain-containing protein [Elusimicrobiota bacterium]